MKCYFVSDRKKENAIFLADENVYIFEGECPEEMIATGNELIIKNEIVKNVFKECVAKSDSGIDYRECDSYPYEICFEKLVFDGKDFVGVYVDEPKRILSFTDEEKRSVEIITTDEFVGGWGDVTEGYSYQISEKK